MRAEGVLRYNLVRAVSLVRLVLNVRLFPAMKLEAVGDKAARFIAPHPDKPKELATYLLRVRGSCSVFI